MSTTAQRVLGCQLSSIEKHLGEITGTPAVYRDKVLVQHQGREAFAEIVVVVDPDGADVMMLDEWRKKKD